MTHRPYPLSGITVIDLGQVYQGPYATLLMAKAGANVIKVEPVAGEPLRARERLGGGMIRGRFARHVGRMAIGLMLLLLSVHAGCAGANRSNAAPDNLRAAAEAGDPEAQTLLGDRYWAKGGPMDVADAAIWYLKAAEQGHSRAQFRVGDMYRLGLPLPQDYGKMAEWYRKSAMQGDSEGQMLLGLAYAKGMGVPLDNIQAHMWLRLSLSREPDAGNRLTRQGAIDQITESMTREQIAEAERLVKDWKPQTGKSQ